MPPEWRGETAFILAGGPSVAATDLTPLAGRRVIAVNSSVFAWPAAEFLVFGDTRWWRQHQAALATFSGRIVTTAQAAMGARLIKMRKAQPREDCGLAGERDALAMQRTTLQAAINLAAHLGAVRLVLIGADMARGADGRSHHHPPHPWPVKVGCWDEQMAQLRWTAAPLERLGIEVINCSMQSRIDWWPKRQLTEV